MVYHSPLSAENLGDDLTSINNLCFLDVAP